MTDISGQPTKENVAPSDEELFLLRKHFEQKQDLSMDINIIIDFAVSTSMRLGEFSRIEWKDFDEKNQTITIRRRKNPDSPKTIKFRLLKTGVLTQSG